MDFESISNSAGFVVDIVTVVAIIGGGIWAYYRFVKARKLAPRVNIDITGRTFVKNRTLFLVISSRLNNVGNIRINLNQRGTGVRLYSFQFMDDVEEAETSPAVRLATFPVFGNCTWIEPLESVLEERLVEIQYSDHTALGIELRVAVDEISSHSYVVVDVDRDVIKKESTNGMSADFGDTRYNLRN